MKKQTPALSRRISLNVRSLAFVAGLLLFAQMAVAAPLTLPFAGDAVPGGIRARDTKTPAVSNGDILSFVATVSYTWPKAVSTMATFEADAGLRKNGGNWVAVYNQSKSSWVFVRLVTKAKPLRDKLGTFQLTAAGLVIDTPQHSELKQGDIIDFVSLPDNPGLVIGVGKTDVRTSAELETALRNRADASGRVAIHFMRSGTLGGFVHINIK